MGLMRRVSFIVTIAGVNLFPQTIFLNKYRKVRARYDFDNNEIPVRKDIEQKFEQVMDEIKLADIHRGHIKLFNVHDLDVFHAGETWSDHGAIIGVPANFEYNDLAAITEQTVSLSVPVNWNSKAAKEFQQSLILSENAQKFAFAKSIFSVAQFSLAWKTLHVVGDAIIGLFVYDQVVSALKVTKEQRLKRCGIAGVIGLVCYISYIFTKSIIDDRTDLDVNQKLLAVGPDYIQGGVEYYRKLSQRNQALRVLLGDMGPYKFTASGNEFFWIAQRKITISSQIDFFSDKLRALQLA